MAETKQKPKKPAKVKNIPKSAAIAIFWGLGILLAAVLILHHNPLADQVTEQMKKVSGCVLIAFTCIMFTIYYDRIVTIPVELFQSRGLIWKLARNDFKKRYAGSYLGIVWALAQPVVTVLMYWIVFDKVFDARVEFVAAGGETPPYVLYLTAGLVPWFYFSEAISQGTTALVEYSYLVKKVVFNISILPIIKVIAATFIHVLFVCILLLVAVGYG
ncbi:MAG: ABC transporter permease, partial [bacterium]|nr:ABC transporter permease [bacterium]